MSSSFRLKFQGARARIKISEVLGSSKAYSMFNTIAQFFKINTPLDFMYNAGNIVNKLEAGELIISGANNYLLYFTLIYDVVAEDLFIYIASLQYDIEKGAPESEDELYNIIEDGEYNVILEIKNRVFEPNDIYIHYANMQNYVNGISSLKLVGEEGEVKLKGVYTCPYTDEAGSSSYTAAFVFANTIMKDYFDSSTELVSTNEITASNGKQVKYSIYYDDYEGVGYIQLAYTDNTGFTEGDAFTFNITAQKNTYLNPIYSKADNVQEAIDTAILNKIMPIGSYYTQYAEEDGSFDDAKSPEALFGGVWELKYNDESVYFRTEGSLASASRKAGLQSDAGRNATGNFTARLRQNGTPNGVFSTSAYDTVNANSGNITAYTVNLNLSRAYTTASEFRVRNRLIRVWLRIA